MKPLLALFYCIIQGFWLPNMLLGQTTVWRLGQCIRYAQINNLQIKQNRLNQELASEKVAYTQKDLYPTVQLAVSPTLALGRSLDPTTYQYATNGFVNNIVGLSMNQVVWAGGRKRNTHEQSVLEEEIAILQETRGMSQIAIQITQAYFQLLLNKVYLKNAERQLAVSKEQLAMVQQPLQGTKDPSYSVLEWQAQVANDEFTCMKYKNELKVAQLNLGTLLALPDPLSLEVEEFLEERPDVKPNPKFKREFDLYYRLASWHPTTKIPQLNQKIAALQYDAVNVSNLPTITLSAGLSLPFSSLFKEVDGASLVRNDTVPVYSAGQLRLALSPSYEYSYKTTSLFSQWKQLASVYVGFQITIPLVTGGMRKYQLKQARLGIDNAQITMQAARTEMYKEAVFTYNNVQAAISQKEAADKNMEVWKSYFESSLARFQKNEITAKDFEMIKNNYFQIQQNAEVARYDLLLKRKLYNYYATGDLAAFN